MSRQGLSFCAAMIALCTTATAQDADSAVPVTPTSGGSAIAPSPSSVHFALGNLLTGPLNVQSNITAPVAPGTAWNRLLGCARAWGYYWVSGGAGTTGAFMIHQYDLAGTYLQSFTQNVANSASTQWGARDLAVDEANFKLWGGMENNQLKEYTFTPAPGGGPNGTLAFTASYTVPITVATIRALARNPNNGHFFTKNFNGSLYEFTIAPLAQVAFLNANGKSTYGLAWDSVNSTLWQFDQNVPGGAATATDGVEFNEIDLTGVLTGRTFVGPLYGVVNANIAGGCDIFNDGSGVQKVVGLHQNTVDELYVYELDPILTPPVVYCTPGTTTNSCSASMSFTGTPSASATSGFTLICNNVEGQKSGIQFYGINGQFIQPWATGSTSFLCIKAPTQRMLTMNSGGTTNLCNGVVMTDFLAFIAANPTALGAPLTTGQVFDVQTWFRDPPAPKTTNLSNGLEFTLAP